ncbi:hypothetical protein GCM10010271_68710 [Streptomyces kurssanovii]|nr:hypothetical protein GCM10010271_68710 [Streptomyces kurssanovii]
MAPLLGGNDVEAEHGGEDCGRKVLGELDQRGCAGGPDGDVVGGQAPGESGIGDVLAGLAAGEKPSVESAPAFQCLKAVRV